VADATCGVQSEWPKPDHDDRHVCALAPDHPHIRNHVCSCGVVFACSRATAGSPSPTPGPTREQVAEATLHGDAALLPAGRASIAAGASDYVTKPVDVDQLLSLMRVWLYR